MRCVGELSEPVTELPDVSLHLGDTLVQVASLLLDIQRRSLTEQKDVLHTDPGSVMSPKKPDVCRVLCGDSHQLAGPVRESLELGPDYRVGKPTGLSEPAVLLNMSIQVAVRTVLYLLHFMFAHLDYVLGNAGQFTHWRVEDDAVVEDPLAVSQHRLRAAVLLPPDVPLHGLNIHRAGDVVLVRRELQGVHWLEEGLTVGDRLHPGQGVLQEGAQLVHGEEPHGPGPCVHVLGRHDEDTLRAHPVLGRADLQLDTLEVEDPGTRLTADDGALFVTDPTVSVIESVQTVRVLLRVTASLEDGLVSFGA